MRIPSANQLLIGKVLQDPPPGSYLHAIHRRASTTAHPTAVISSLHSRVLWSWLEHHLRFFPPKAVTHST